MTLTRWEPLREFSTMQDRLNRMSRLFRESLRSALQGELAADFVMQPRQLVVGYFEIGLLKIT